ncbi:cytochrome C biogenesis protein CcdA [Agaricicola taiwanensis]|uniref:Cytochrome C biogenesis protein CcdA n=1 Tax=Agaricicola taiwanensis TaxID=591372 RepID=A0A8J2VZW1_9RHOB|nr:cytochrome c biogenesis protein CcdA [Agaricicola taiwanensis]GGE41936.1 cytochrome C biogenesis protein CcdA [Agaricicola taiwanensis]
MVEELSIPILFLAGLLSFLSPCVLPLVPAYLTYLAGTTTDHISGGAVSAKAVTGRAFGAAGLFVLGFSTVFVILGAAASALSALLREYFEVLSMLAGAAIIVMGLHFLGVFRIALLYREARFQTRRPVGLWGAYVMGLAFAFGWTPCIGPVLGAILAVAASQTTVATGAGYLAIYAAGLGLPFLVAAFAARPFAAFLTRFRQHIGMVEKVTGALLVLVGVGFLSGWMSTLAFWMLETWPVLGQLG